MAMAPVLLHFGLLPFEKFCALPALAHICSHVECSHTLDTMQTWMYGKNEEL